MKDKNIAAIFALIGGTIGLQQAYLGNTNAFVLSIIFCWTGLPAIISFFHAIYLILVEQKKFDEGYNDDKCSDVCTLLNEMKSTQTPSNKYVDDLPEF